MGSIRFPNVTDRLGLGVGLDIPWGSPDGFQSDSNQISESTTRFLRHMTHDFSYYFLSFQPKNRGSISADDYLPAYHDLRKRWPNYATRALHHTQLNLGTLDPYDKRAVVRFTNKLVDEMGFSWINEDLGLWSFRGKPLPYPLPPFLTERGLKAAIDNTRYYQENLNCPVLVEFPGFSEGVSFIIGDLDGFEFFSRVVTETDSPCTLDTGHIISYQWLKGNRDQNLFEGLEILPFENCFEIHLSGCQIIGDKFMDLHHGILLKEQLSLLDYLIPRCPNLKAITYEDPKFTKEGILIPKAVDGFEFLKARVSTFRETGT